MKTYCLILALVLTSHAWCDTIDHWTISRNDVVLARFNIYSTDLTVNIPAASLVENDYLSLSYFSCSMCINCHKQLYLEGISRSRILLTESKNGIPLRLNLASLYRIALFFKLYKISLFYAENDATHRVNHSVAVAILRFT